MSKINIQSLFKDSISLKNKCIEQGFDSLIAMGDAIVSSIINGGKLLLCGNGGSAADAQHLAAELLVRLRPNYNRAGLPAISLSLDTSTITACGNDFSYDELFARNSFIESDFKGDFRPLSQNELYDVVFEFYNNFLFNCETKNKQHLNYKSTFSYYLKNSKYSETYIKNQEKYLRE